MNGWEFCRRLRATPSGKLMPFIFLSGQKELETRISSHAHGADTYLTKPVNRRELLTLIQVLLERDRRIQAEITRLTQLSIQQPSRPLPPSTASLWASTNTTPGVTPCVLPLTPAEQRVFWQVIMGFSNQQIGERLFLSPRTVQGYVSSTLHKLGLNSRSQLIHYAYSQGFISPKHEQSPKD
jgi:DNA-binding NarL/FixJ family response regulator